jgi:hypothetical protein
VLLVVCACGGPHPDAVEIDAAARDTGAPPRDDASSPEGDGGPMDRHDVLFVGNSYVFVNDVSGHYRAITSDLFDQVRVEEVTAGGYRLEQHAADARTDGTALARWLRNGAIEETSFDAVVLQEQSQIGGFPTLDPARAASVAAASELAALAHARGAAIVLYATWGYEHGDPTNPALGFGTYLSMQDRLDRQYVGLASRLREEDEGADVRIAPVGGAFRTVYRDVLAAGGEPGAEGSDFDALYEPDGSHPSLRGAYLASCVIAGTITAVDPRALVDEPALGPEVSGRLRDACARTLADPRWQVPVIIRPSQQLAGDRVSYAALGTAVALASDGTLVLVGARGGGPGAMGSARAVVLGTTGATGEIVWRGASGLGSVIALAGDGRRALIGPPAQIHRRDRAASEASTWTEETQLPAGAATITQSTALALSEDGTRAIAGQAWDDGPDGGDPPRVSARISVRGEEVWDEEAAITLRAPSPRLPVAVAIDARGERAIVGDATVRVFARGTAGWAEEAELVSEPGRVAISADGTRAVVGLPDGNRAVVFARTGATWSEIAVLIGWGDIALGSAVALSADGSRVLVGIPYDAPAATGLVSGSARLYALRSGTYVEEALLVPRDVPLASRGPAAFGAAVALSADGTTAAVGAPFHGDAELASVGAAYLFALD